ncbi:MAG: TonB-dependent receptor [Verrucomicrobiaceae bacterium]|nr:TonB-dependent receptor [Verrucomicrobiaceae bacterium]
MYLPLSRGRASVLLFALSGLQAAEPASTNELAETVVTATKTETERWHTASSVTVISRQQIEDGQFRLLPEALRQVPGLTLATPGIPGTVTTVMSRGTTTKDTALLIDGRPVPNNLAGSFNLESMALDNVERIEVLRGPAASLYGGRSLGGVINIITRSGKGVETPQGTVYAETGSYGTFREGLSTLGSAGMLDWSLEGSRADMQGQRQNTQLQQNNAAGRFGITLSEALRFDLDTRYFTTGIGTPRDTGTNDPNDHVFSEFWSISPRLVYDDGHRWRHSLTYSHTQFRQVATGFTTPPQVNNRVSARTDWLEYQSTLRLTEKWSLTAGAWLQDQTISRYNDTAGRLDIDENQTNLALFLQSQAEVLPGLHLTGGLRFDSYSDFEDLLTWRGGISYRVPITQTVLHVNYGTAFTPPSPQDITPVFGGNPALLQPERSRGWEIGIEQPMLKNTLHLAITGFRNDLRDTYQYPPPFFIPQAIGEATTYGIESSLAWTPCREFAFHLSHTWLHAYDDTNMARLVRRPQHTIAANMTLQPHRDVSLSLGANWVLGREDFYPTSFAPEDVEDYLALRLSANWRLSKRFELFARIENLLGEKYAEIPGFPAMSTGAYAGFKLRF